MSLFLAVAGNIGTGKTTLTRMIGEHFGFKIFYESVDNNPYLTDFYADMARWSFNIQIFFLSERFKAHQRIIENKSSSIQDRTIYEDKEIFARALFEQGDMSQRDYENYLALNTHMSSFLQPPDLLIYLRKSVPRLLENINKRNRGFENNIPISYLQRLNSYYDDWIEKYNLGNVITIQSDDLDFVSNLNDFDLILDKIETSLPQQKLLGLKSKPYPIIREVKHDAFEQMRLL